MALSSLAAASGQRQPPEHAAAYVRKHKRRSRDRIRERRAIRQEEGPGGRRAPTPVPMQDPSNPAPRGRRSSRRRDDQSNSQRPCFRAPASRVTRDGGAAAASIDIQRCRRPQACECLWAREPPLADAGVPGQLPWQIAGRYVSSTAEPSPWAQGQALDGGRTPHLGGLCARPRLAQYHERRPNANHGKGAR